MSVVHGADCVCTHCMPQRYQTVGPLTSAGGPFTQEPDLCTAADAPGRDFVGPTPCDIDVGDHMVPAGTLAFMQRESAPRETWPANFREDEECPGLGVWSCPVCLGTKTPREPAEGAC